MRLLAPALPSANAQPGTERKVSGRVLAWAKGGIQKLLGKGSKGNGSAPADSSRFDIPTPPPGANGGVDKTRKIPSLKEESALTERVITASLTPATSTAGAVDITEIQRTAGSSSKKVGGQGTAIVGEQHTAKVAPAPLLVTEKLSANPDTWSTAVSASDDSLGRLVNEAAVMREIHQSPKHHNFPKLVTTNLFSQNVPPAAGRPSSTEFMPGVVMTTVQNYVRDKDLALFLRQDVPIQLFIDDLALELIHAYRLSQVQVTHEGAKVPFCHRDISDGNMGWGKNSRTKKMGRWSMDAGLARSLKAVSLTGQMQGSPRWMSRTQMKSFDMKLLNPAHDFISRLYRLLDTYLKGVVRNDNQGEALFGRFDKIVDIPDLPALMERANFPRELRELYEGIPAADHAAAIMTEKQREFIERACRTVFSMSSFNTPGQSFDKVVADPEEQGFAFRCPGEGEKISDWMKEFLEHYRTAPEFNEHNRGTIEWRPETSKMGTGTKVALGAAAVAAAVAALFAAGVFNKKPEHKPDAAANVKAAPKVITKLFANESNIPNVTVERNAEGDFQGETLFKGTPHQHAFTLKNTAWLQTKDGNIPFACTRLSAADMAALFGIDEKTLLDRIASKGADFESPVKELREGGVKDVAMYYLPDGRQAYFIGGGVGIYIVSDDDGKFSVFGLDIANTKSPELLGRSSDHRHAKLHPNLGPVIHGVDMKDDAATVINPKMRFDDGRSRISGEQQMEWMLGAYVSNMQKEIPKVSPLSFAEFNEKFPGTVTASTSSGTNTTISVNIVNAAESMDVPLGPYVPPRELPDSVLNLPWYQNLVKDGGPMILRPKEEMVAEASTNASPKNVVVVINEGASVPVPELDPREIEIPQLKEEPNIPVVIPNGSDTNNISPKKEEVPPSTSMFGRLKQATNSAIQSIFGGKTNATDVVKTNTPTPAEVKARFEAARQNFITNEVINVTPKGYTPVLKGTTNDVAQTPVPSRRKEEEQPVEP